MDIFASLLHRINLVLVHIVIVRISAGNSCPLVGLNNHLRPHAVSPCITQSVFDGELLTAHNTGNVALRSIKHLNVLGPLDIFSFTLLHLLLYCSIVVKSILHGGMRHEAYFLQLRRFHSLSSYWVLIFWRNWLCSRKVLWTWRAL